MILPDINLLIFAYNSEVEQHPKARRWWEETMSGNSTVCIPWAVIFGFIRLTTHRRVFSSPLRVSDALEIVSSWIECENVRILEASPKHFAVFSSLLAKIGTGANMVTDTHLAALAIEHNLTLYSNDLDFSRFPGLRWKNPLNAQLS